MFSEALLARYSSQPPSVLSAMLPSSEDIAATWPCGATRSISVSTAQKWTQRVRYHDSHELFGTHLADRFVDVVAHARHHEQQIESLAGETGPERSQMRGLGDVHLLDGHLSAIFRLQFVKTGVNLRIANRADDAPMLTHELPGDTPAESPRRPDDKCLLFHESFSAFRAARTCAERSRAPVTGGPHEASHTAIFDRT